MSVTPEQSNRLWATYHHIRQLEKKGQDSQGNRWAQSTYGTRQGHLAADFLEADELCGTGQCFAGWYATLRGMKMNGWGDILLDGNSQTVAAFTAEDAGLDGGNEEMSLFAGSNTLSMIADALVDITGEDRRND